MIINKENIVFVKTLFLVVSFLFAIKIKKEKQDFPEMTIQNNPVEVNAGDHVIDVDVTNNTANHEIDDLNQIENKKQQDLEDLNRYNELSDLPKNPNDPLIIKERNTILEAFYSDTKKTNITIFFDCQFPFGNQIAAFNKLIFFCEIIKCKTILLTKENNMFINHTLYDKVHNLTIEVLNYFPYDSDFLTSLSPNFFFDIYNLKIENRLDIIKNEIVKNLPKINLGKNDLIIHFRSSDIFQNQNNPEHAPDYAQPPLCFYLKILTEFKFKKIYLISVDEIYNPVIKKLKEMYPKIKYKENPLEVDIAYLVRGYNIVGSISSFLISSLKLNDNLVYLWEYDRYPMCSKLYHSHHSIYNIKRKYTIYQMEPSDVYKNKMIVWKCSDEQIEIMLNDKCPNDFKIVPPNIS